MTKQREAVLNVIRATKCHYSAEELLLEVRKIMPTISRATVYNTLRYLEQKREILRIKGDDGIDRYDQSFIPHGHMICTRCNGIMDFTVPRLESALKKEAGDYESYELKVRYLCPECKKRAQDEAQG